MAQSRWCYNHARLTMIRPTAAEALGERILSYTMISYDRRAGHSNKFQMAMVFSSEQITALGIMILSMNPILPQHNVNEINSFQGIRMTRMEIKNLCSKWRLKEMGKGG